MRRFLPSLICCLFQIMLNGQNYQWVKTFGTQNYSTSFLGEICTDQNKDIYNIGAFMESGDFNPTKGTYSMKSSGLNDIFLVKMDENGDFRWAKKFGSDQDDVGYSLHIDSSRNLLFAGSFQDTCDFDYNGSVTYNLYAHGASDAFVAKLDTNGQFLWAKQIGGTGSDAAKVVRCDSKGYVYVGGYFSGLVDFDPGINNYYLTSTGTVDGFLLKLNPDGEFLWAINFPAKMNSQISKICITADNDIYATGLFKGKMSINTSTGTSEVNSIGEFDIFIAKIQENGNAIWQKSIGGPNTEEVFDICQYQNEIALCGYFNDSIDLDPGSGKMIYHTNGGHDIFVLKITKNGNYKWAETLGGRGSDEARSLKYNSIGELYIAGMYENDPDFNPGIPENKLTAGWGTGFFLQKITSTDFFKWVISTKGVNNSYLAIDKLDNVIVSGINYNRKADFDPGPGKSDSLSWQPCYNVKYSDPSLNSHLSFQKPTISIYPNPAHQILWVNGLSAEKVYNFSIYNALSQIISSGQIQISNNQILIPPSQSGLVFIKIDQLPAIPIFISGD